MTESERKKRGGLMAELTGSPDPQFPEIPEKSSEENPQLLLIKENYNPENIEMKTDLTEDAVRDFARGNIFADHYGCDILRDYMTGFMTMMVSKGRKGRSESIEMARATQPRIDGDDPNSPKRPRVLSSLFGAERY